MRSEFSDVEVSYFVICDQIITEAGTNKQSIIGVYTAMGAPGFPMLCNLAVGVSVRVKTAKKREIRFSLLSPDGTSIFDSPPLPANWANVEAALRTTGFGVVQIGVNVKQVPFDKVGTHSAALYCDGEVIATYPFIIQLQG